MKDFTTPDLREAKTLPDELSPSPHSSQTERDERAIRIGLQASEALYRDLFQQASDSIFLVDLNTHRFLDVNPSAARRLGYTRKELLALTLEDIEVAMTSPRMWTSSGSDSIVTEGRHRRKNGSHMPVEVSSRVVSYGEQQVLQMFARDITQRLQAEEREKLLAIEKQRVQLLGNFVRTAAQEFRTPLTLVNTSLYFLERVTDEQQWEHHNQKLKDQIQYISQLVEAMLAMARLESASEFDMRPVDLNHLLEFITTDKREQIRSKGLSLQLDLANALPVAYGDSDELQQAFTHLINNAIDFTPPGGTITLHTSRQNHARQGHEVMVAVSDTGIGISQDELSPIFDPFYRVDQAMTERKPGLGLSIAQKIITLHHGRIEVESVIDQGTTFRVFLPTELPA